MDGAYRETPAREFLGATLRGQDLLTLLAVPVLVGAAVRARRGSLRAHILWLGIVLSVPCTYLMYVAAPYNDAFLLYVAAIGIGAYLLLDGLLRIDVRAMQGICARVPRQGPGWFLIDRWAVRAAVAGPEPDGDTRRRADGLFVYDVPSTVHVLDLAFVLPLVIASGVLLVRDA